MGDVSAEPSMEDILSSIKRIIAEDAEGAVVRGRRRPVQTKAVPQSIDDDILELSDPAPGEDVTAAQDEPDAPEAIISDAAAQASRAPLDTLSRLVVKPETPGSDTLEGLVREMLKPMLRQWLDANLPELVETMVAREIARITGQR